MFYSHRGCGASLSGQRRAAAEANWAGGQRRTNQTHQSTTDPDARLFRKGGVGAVLSYLGHVLLDNRHGLVVNTCVTVRRIAAVDPSALLFQQPAS